MVIKITFFQTSSTLTKVFVEFFWFGFGFFSSSCFSLRILPT